MMVMAVMTIVNAKHYSGCDQAGDDDETDFPSLQGGLLRRQNSS